MTQPKPSEAAIAAAVQHLRSTGKCGSNDGTGILCNQTANHQGRRHKSQIFGGANDGQTLKEWDW